MKPSKYMVRTAAIAIGAIIGGSAVLVGCQSDTRGAPYAEQWNHDKEVRYQSNELNGYNGSFACHTADGGCLHMSCTTKSSCDYMAQAEKTCAVPTAKDKLVIVEDDSCKSTLAATTYPSAGTVTSLGNGGWAISGTTASTVSGLGR